MKSKSALVGFIAILLVVSPVLTKPGLPEQESYSPVGTYALLDSFVNVTTQNTRFIPATFTVPVNASVHVRITQKDPMPHTFTVSAQADYVIPSTVSPAQLDTYFQNNNLTDVAIPSTVNSVVWANFTAPARPGQYEFSCRIGGHFQSGMFGFMIVERREAFVNVTTQNVHFSPDRFTVKPGATVHVRITQKDPMPHTFTVSAQADYVIPSTVSPAQLDTYFQNNNLTDVAIPSTVNSVVWANFTAPARPGQYEFSCRIGGHFQSGMFGFMIVSEEAVPPPPPGLPFGVVTGIMVGTLVVVLVFAAIYQVRAVRAAKRPR